ncbi:E3 ubiquitin-protein ligase tom1 [Lecanora helva]
MGRIKKAAGAKHEATVVTFPRPCQCQLYEFKELTFVSQSPAIAEFVAKASYLPISHLPAHLKSFPQRWPFPKGDLYHWIPLFNRFDRVLDQFSSEYGLHDGPQTRPFQRILLLKGVAEETKAESIQTTSDEELDVLHYASDGDRQLVEVILDFSRQLLENCGNRSLYSSSERLGDLLNTTSLSLLTTTLQLAVRLAQRYYASRQRGANASQHMNSALLASHYSIDLEKVQKLANPFTKSTHQINPPNSTSAVTPKGKEKAQPQQTRTPSTVNANDFLAFTQPTRPSANGSIKHDSTSERKERIKPDWDEWGSVSLTYYQSPTGSKEDSKLPTTPTPVRIQSGLSRPSRLSSSEGSPEVPLPASTATNNKVDDSTTGGIRRLEIPYVKIRSSAIEQILHDSVENLPKDSQYELLNKLRSARALTGSLMTRQELVGIRLLAITNLSYIYPDNVFQQKILQQDSEEPRRLQLVYQLADLVHAPGNGSSGIPVKLQALALGALEAFAKQKAKAPDVCAALNINVNHGVLFYVLHKAVAEMATEDSIDENGDSEVDERQEALFSLLEALPASTPRTGEALVAAGLLEILIEVLNLRTQKAERAHPKVLTFLSTFLYTVRDAMQSLANSKGLDAISDLLNFEVQTSLQRAAKGDGLPAGFKTRSTDYQIPYFQQQSLRVIFKLIAHMMAHGSGNLDRLLRNLIDSPQLLSGLHTVITNATIFGSAVWSGAVNILSVSIHNEPTSYAVISEAGLSKGLLDAVTSRSDLDHPMKIFLQFKGESDISGPALTNASSSSIANFMQDTHSRTLRQAKFAPVMGILPNSDAILGVPQAFGAICLNHAGMQLFLESGALDSFFKVFESDDHIKALSPSTPEREDLPRLLGNSFDELVRHHPNLKMPVMIAIITMIERVGHLCKWRANTEGCGAKLWLQGQNGELVPAGCDSLSDQANMSDDSDKDVVMGEASPIDGDDTSSSGLRADPAEPSRRVSEKRENTGGATTAMRIDVTMNFLAGFLENATLCSFFVESSGSEYVLDLATLPSLPHDFNVHNASSQLARVIHIMVEQKAHLVLPSLIQRTQEVAHSLKPLSEYAGDKGFFTEFTCATGQKTARPRNVSHASIGTSIVKSLVNVQNLCNILLEVFSTPIFSPRSGHTPFSQVNLADKYRDLIKTLGMLHRICVWEEILLQKELPEAWKEPTKMKGLGMGSDEADEILGVSTGDTDAPEAANPPLRNGNTGNNEATASARAEPSNSGKEISSASIAQDEKTASFKNTKILRHLLSQVPSFVVQFYQNLGKSLVPKRRPDAYPRQNAYMVAQAMSDASLEQLRYAPPKQTTSIKDRNHMDRPSAQVLTLLLQCFKNDGGLDAIKEILEVFYEEVNSPDNPPQGSDQGEIMARKLSATGGIKIILAFFIQITQSKSIIDSSQSHAIVSNERDRGQLNYFSPPQFLVELRMAILPVITSIWNSEFVDKTTGSLVGCIIDILRTILEGAEEQGAFKRGDEQPAAKKASFRVYNIHIDKVDRLVEQGFDPDVAREALYRCFNNQSLASEYCLALKHFPKASRNPIPDYDKEAAHPTLSQTTPQPDSETILPNSGPTDSTGNAVTANVLGDIDREMMTAILNQSGHTTHLNGQSGLPDTPAPTAPTEAEANVEIQETGEGSRELEQPPTLTSVLPPPAPGFPTESDSGTGDPMAMSIDNLQDIIRGIGRSSEQEQTYSSRQVSTNNAAPVQLMPQKSRVTVDDLDAERKIVRENIIDKALDVLNTHDDVTFELGDLINAAALKADDAKTMRKEIGETLVQSLISLQEDDLRPIGKKVASYANLLALVVQDREFYEATLDQLTEFFEQLLSFIKIHPDQPADEASPWIGQILLVIEKMLAEDVQPTQIQWDVPADGKTPGPLVDIGPSLVPLDHKIQLFEAISDVLLKVGKDESLALSIVRTLVILTRNQEIASRLSEKRNIQRLFVMIKQLAGIFNDKLPNSFMILLRHIVEDEDTIRQIMRSEIMSRFETRPGRASTTDTTGYVKQMYDLVIRSPHIFVEITNEKLEIPRYDAGSGNTRPQILQLKAEPKENRSEEEQSASKNEQAGDVANQEESVNGKVAENLEPPVAGELHKPKVPEVKAAVRELSSGVIHYLLQELLAYKDVDDKDSTLATKEPNAETLNESRANVDHTDGSPAANSTPGGDTSNPLAPEAKKTEKPEFKPSEHPIHMYRNFILQCLAELLHCYNRTKIEFINFSRKADPKVMTPSKPRSWVLNYLLNDVIPIGTLGHEETIAYRKKNNTSNWAMSTIVSLCLRTNENGYLNKQGSINEDDETDLLFVRKFVLEHALKAYKDANASDEHPDVKYARLLDLADLFNRLLQGRILPLSSSSSPGLESGFQKSIARLMFEKNFIGALTGSIADIDLNFPGSKRAIKYILRPLKQLTQTAIVLSQTSDISTTPGQSTDDDEISTATSVSEAGDDREETPDLFRNSTLGMLEPGREEESSSESSDEDEEMYEDDYDDGMEFDEGIERDEDDVISDEDEDLGEAGHMEGLPGDTSMGVEVVIDDNPEASDDDDDVDDDGDDDEEADQDDSEAMDDGSAIQVIDEITGDSENASLAGGEDDGWQDEDGEDSERYNEQDLLDDNDFSQDQDAENAVRDIVREFGGAEAALQRLEGMDDEQAEGLDRLNMDIEAGRYMDDVVHRDDEDDDDDDEDAAEDDVDDDDVIYQPDYDDDDSGMPEPPFGWDPEEDGFAPPRGHHHHHHHHHPRRTMDPWSGGFPGGALDRHVPLYRSHRPVGGPRSADDGVNPLLQRNDRTNEPRRARGVRTPSQWNDSWVHGMDRRGLQSGESPLTFLNSLLSSVEGRNGLGFSAVNGANGAVHLHIAGDSPGGLPLPRELQIALGVPRPAQADSRLHREEHQQPATFQPAITSQRWQEEARLLYGSGYLEKALKVVNSILHYLVPPAIEKKKREEEETKRLREQAEKSRKEEQEAKEKAEKEEQEKREQEEREAAAAREAAEAEVRSQREEQQDGQESAATDDSAMEGVETDQAEGSATGGEVAEVPTSVDEPTEEASGQGSTAGPSEPTERVRTTIRGRELDITGLGIDLAYLDALPEDIREEVLMSQLAVQRSQAAASGEEPTDISREFLEALPADIREEILQQEAQDRRRRERIEAQRRQQAAGGSAAARAEDMDPASFLASLEPTLRQHVLMEQDEEMLANLPEDIAAEARALAGDRPMHRFQGIPRAGPNGGAIRHLLGGSRPPPPATKKPPRRQIVQMLDKAGVATLLRLMFIPQQGSSRQSLNGILHDASQNRQNRAEVISLLLSILQDGSADVNAIERSFNQLSLRAKQPAAQKTPQPLKRSLTGPLASAANNMEATPSLVIQQCLSALVSLTQYNAHVPSFFLTEHEISSGMKTKTLRKGKAKESRASKFALNALLGLLDRKLIMESSSCMEQLATLLQSVTHPLTMLLKKEKENAEEKADETKIVEAQAVDPETAVAIESGATEQAPAEAEQPNEHSTADITSPMVDAQAESNNSTEQQAVPAATTVNEAREDADKKPSDQEKVKKQRALTPPVVPEENLRLVVNILAARECSAKTFRDTLSTINNLSAIPGAKEVFGKGLVEQAQDLGKSILQDLDELVPQIQQAENGTDIQGMALSKFSPASSDQAKLLRVLTALDYLFDPKRNGGKTKSVADDGESTAQSSETKEIKADILTTLYENPTFGSLWNKLSECLSSIRQREGMLNVATILLPLVEALMVVCKNTTLKDVPLIKAAKEFSITSPPPESYMENLFFKFTEEHRKILNDLVRHNPKLMSGTFSLLVKNPKVLEFDNKRNYFTRRLHSRGTEARHPQPPLQLSVRREEVFLDSFKFLHFKSGDEIKYGKLSIRFNGEEGVDAGGVTREWFQVLSRQMFNPDYALFIPVASDRTTFHPNKLSKVNDEHLMFFKFIGRIIGKALYEGRALDCHFSRAVYKRILGKTVSIKDMETLDLEYYKSLLWMLDNDISDIITETFSVETDDFGVTEIVDLCENGRNVAVTEENKQEYVQLMVEYRLTGSVQAQLEQFLKGFHDIVPPELISIFNEQELELLISGLPDIDVDDWKNHTEYHNYQASSAQIQWFWRAVRSFDKEERAKLLQFVTGTSKVPLNGFDQLEGMNGFSRFNIHRDYGNKDRLPSSHTCFNQLDLPEYDSYEALRQQLYTAMTAGSEYFGFA